MGKPSTISEPKHELVKNASPSLQLFHFYLILLLYKDGYILAEIFLQYKGKSKSLVFGRVQSFSCQVEQITLTNERYAASIKWGNPIL